METTKSTNPEKTYEELAYQRIVETRKRSYEKYKDKRLQYVRDYFQNVIKSNPEKYEEYKRMKCEKSRQRRLQKKLNSNNNVVVQNSIST